MMGRALFVLAVYVTFDMLAQLEMVCPFPGRAAGSNEVIVHLLYLFTYSVILRTYIAHLQTSFTNPINAPSYFNNHASGICMHTSYTDKTVAMGSGSRSKGVACCRGRQELELCADVIVSAAARRSISVGGGGASPVQKKLRGGGGGGGGGPKKFFLNLPKKIVFFFKF